MVTRIHPQCALTRPLCFQDHLVLGNTPPFQDHLALDNPQYADMDDAELGRLVRAKYPAYSDYVDAEPVAEQDFDLVNSARQRSKIRRRLSVGAARAPSSRLLRELRRLGITHTRHPAPDARNARLQRERSRRGAASALWLHSDNSVVQRHRSACRVVAPSGKLPNLPEAQPLTRKLIWTRVPPTGN